MKRIGTGTRRSTAKAVRAAAKSAPEQFKALFIPFLPELARILKADARDRECVGHRTAINAILDGLEVTGSKDQLLRAFLERMDARDEEHALQLAQRARAADSATLYEVRRDAVEILKLSLLEDPEYELELRVALFGRRAERSEAVVLPQ